MINKERFFKLDYRQTNRLNTMLAIPISFSDEISWGLYKQKNPSYFEKYQSKLTETTLLRLVKENLTSGVEIQTINSNTEWDSKTIYLVVTQSWGVFASEELSKALWDTLYSIL